ncbi:classical arabinogalactan protein 9-like [Diaphorina citri]|uniref:Classical arabinogalactan protein 9-like n=1 Tax=Diaphorina citri TaxID=121845 RepID=A0A3Q0J304_DIACI|nr:classical arabinogalactan protein 9-like [Diaphorina citri]
MGLREWAGQSMSTPPPVISFPPPSPPAGTSGATPSDVPVVPDPAPSSSVTVVENHDPPAGAVDDPSPPADTPPLAEVASDKDPELIPDMDSVMECDTPRNAGKKRGNSSSPVNDKIDKPAR